MISRISAAKKKRVEAGPTKLYTLQATLVIIYPQSEKLLLERTPNAFFKDTAPASDMEEKWDVGEGGR